MADVCVFPVPDPVSRMGGHMTCDLFRDWKFNHLPGRKFWCRTAYVFYRYVNVQWTISVFSSKLWVSVLSHYRYLARAIRDILWWPHSFLLHCAREAEVPLSVCGFVTTITRNYVHRSSPNWVLQVKVVTISSWLNFGCPTPRGRGLRRGEIFGSALLQPVHSVCVSSKRFFHLFMLLCVFPMPLHNI